MLVKKNWIPSAIISNYFVSEGHTATVLKLFPIALYFTRQKYKFLSQNMNAVKVTELCGLEIGFIVIKLNRRKLQGFHSQLGRITARPTKNSTRLL